MLKTLMEQAMRAATREFGSEGSTLISCVGCGNVIYPSGSVIRLFSKENREGQVIMISDPVSYTHLTLPTILLV